MKDLVLFQIRGDTRIGILKSVPQNTSLKPCSTSFSRAQSASLSTLSSLQGVLKVSRYSSAGRWRMLMVLLFPCWRVFLARASLQLTFAYLSCVLLSPPLFYVSFILIIHLYTHPANVFSFFFGLITVHWAWIKYQRLKYKDVKDTILDLGELIHPVEETDTQVKLSPCKSLSHV